MPPAGATGVIPTRASPLPVDAAVPALLAALADHGAAVLQAPPGSGKTTRIPLALLDAGWLGGGRVLVLEPRRVAARAAARRMAWLLGETLGDRVGYRIRQERVGGRATRIEVVTEGVLTRLLQDDPSLEGVGAVVFDEFHERGITADLGLALCLDARGALRPDLRVLVMSATLDTAAVASLLDQAPVVTASTVSHPVATVWVGRPGGRVDAAVARIVVRALAEREGDVLVFLPGGAEIRSVERLLREDSAATLAVGHVEVMTLHGAMSGPAQDAVLLPAAPGHRKVVLATSIAETSLTLDGVRVVVDSGLMRVPRFDPAAGMTRLVTLPVSQAAAEQRQGRAARQGPGACYRMWAATDHAGLPRATPPEILVSDLAPLALDLAEWGVDDPARLRWIDPPPTGRLGAARQVLTALGAIDDNRRITRHGRAMARLGVAPRLGHLLLRARDTEPSAPGTTLLAAEIAAVLSEGDPWRAGGDARRDADLTSRVDTVRQGRAPRLAEMARRWLRLLGVPASGTDPRRPGPIGAVVPEDVGRLVALAYPDRVGRQRPGRPGHWLLRNGRGAWLPDADPLTRAVWIVAAELDGERGDARIWLAAPLHPDDVEDLFGAEMITVHRSGWDHRLSDVVDHTERRLGPIVMRTTTSRGPVVGGAPAGLIEGIRSVGLQILPWTVEIERFRSRVAFARRIDGEGWADLGDEALVDDLESWLAPWLEGRTRRADLATVALASALCQRVGWDRRADLDTVAPTHLTMPTGARRRVEYPPDGAPSISVRLQELFGTSTTPTVARGRVPVQLHLTSPAGRPVQVTSDLASFWQTTYPQIRGALRARYPRHSWPEDPLTAVATSRAIPKRGSRPRPRGR